MAPVSPTPDKGSGLFAGLSMASPTRDGDEGGTVKISGEEEETPRIANNRVVDISGAAPKLVDPQNDSAESPVGSVPAVSALPQNGGHGPPANGPSAALNTEVPPAMTAATV